MSTNPSKSKQIKPVLQMSDMFKRPLFQVCPHEKAPLFNRPIEEVQLLFEHLISEVTSPNFSTANEECNELIRQACLVNLWFFLVGVAAHSGPYDKINTDLHLEMCNWRQSKYCMDPATRSAIFIPRGHFKSTVCTHGADSWELLRNPDLRIGLTNAKIDKAEQFKNIIHRTFDSNELFAFFFPDYVIKPGRSKLILPNRSKFFSEPSVKCVSPGSAAEGDHFDLFDADDLIGEADIDAERRSNTNMETKIEWMKTAEMALLDSWRISRINLKGTFWASDDLYANLVLRDCKEFLGYENEDFVPNEKGKWTIYYRTILENDKVIFPERFTKEQYEKMLETSYWQAMTQYANNPLRSGTTEFAELELKKAVLIWDEKAEEYLIFVPGDTNFGEEERTIKLSECDVLMSTDIAGTDKKEATLKHSKTALQIWAMDSESNAYLIWDKYGHYGILQTFDYIYEGAMLFQGYMDKCLIEANAFQKVLKPLLRVENERRGQYIYFKPICADTDKVVRIRNTWAPRMLRGQVYICSGTGTGIKEEKGIFPQSPKKLDALDAGEKALVTLRPLKKKYKGEKDWDNEENLEQEYAEGRNRTTGY